MKLVVDWLPKVLADLGDIEARSQLMWASTLANSWVIGAGKNGAGPMHFIEHCLSGYYDISHGRGLAIVLPVLWYYNCETAPEKYANIAKRVFDICGEGKTESELGFAGVDAMVAWLKANNLYFRLSDVGIDDKHFKDIANDCVRIYESFGGGDGSLRNPRRLGVDEIVALLGEML
jgi:alcohol dehydrogenase YqhD (iron-dependent ADH family)